VSNAGAAILLPVIPTCLHLSTCQPAQTPNAPTSILLERDKVSKFRLGWVWGVVLQVMLQFPRHLTVAGLGCDEAAASSTSKGGGPCLFIYTLHCHTCTYIF
jgi:hypothetical protein